ncbi:sigma-54-dependent transcriptional regulator [Sphingorhabdus sp. 109]|uniref:sigma-54-dependent transcriptional regulator n=1 Tax=Sphingorhabdus sp. 109 TaxID=2653173 RepID=UPI0012F171F1|nr:sigma-54 dependent transcriptional regulator [Sphingorhabdus sp. 109]VWX58416.1 Regulatory protein LuxO [Sphingorhabdus sp. 109]
MSSHKILIIEDIASLSIAYAGHLETAGFHCVIVDNLADANIELGREDSGFSAVLLDLQLPDGNGLDWLENNGAILSEVSVIVATADGSINRAIDAMRLGAYDFMVKPLSPTRLVTVMKGAVEVTKSVRTDEDKAPENGSGATDFAGFIGASPPMQEVYRQIKNVANSKATVFITGESGTGKEVCADAIHKAGPRAKKPFVAINCGAIPEDLLESELFGHLKGSFTGAITDRVGAVQAAHGGTLFLDEICEMQLKLQVKLLRFLQTGTVQRVGATQAEDVDVRIICATNRNPAREVEQGRFREDLYYRLAVVPIGLPPLRERGSDITLIANSFLMRFAEEEGKKFLPLSASLAESFERHNWPGNVRELQNLMRRAAVMFPGPHLDSSLLPEFVDQTAPVPERPSLAPEPAIARAASIDPEPFDGLSKLDGMTLDQIERLVVERAVCRCDGSLTKAARQLGVSPSTLYRKREKWDMAASEA